MEALIFDFDGLIVDTEGPVYQAWAEVFEAHGRSLGLDFWKGIIGGGHDTFDPLAELQRQLGRGLDTEAVQGARRAREMELVAELAILPGVLQWRQAAARAGVRLGIASSSSRAWVTGHLARLGLDGWDCIRCREDVRLAKPAPDLYLSVCRGLGAAPARAIALEDSGPGVTAAKTAGLYCVAVPSSLTGGHDLGRADLVLSALTDADPAAVMANIPP